jgi:RNA polymerase sigma factor (sigma-70 family)
MISGNNIIPQLRRAMLMQGAAGLTDGQLLGWFIEDRDDTAFAALVRRHGPMVWGVCCRVLANRHDAEDAFQATFLVLVRKAASVAPREMVANWLYGVARRTALKARATAARRKSREKQCTQVPEPAVIEQGIAGDLRPELDKSLSRLPEKYRVAIVLCDLESKTRKEAARQLGCPEGTLAARLARARTMLAKRLARHGFVPAAGSLAAVLSADVASAAVPTSVMDSTIKSVSAVTAGQVAGTGVISANVASLTEGVLRAMLFAKLRVATVLLIIGGAACVGAAVSGHVLIANANATATQQEEKSTASAQFATQPIENSKDGQAAGQPPPESKVRELQKERIAALKQIRADKETNVQSGTGPIEDVLQAQAAVLRAELEMCESDKETTKLLGEIVAVAKELEKCAEQRFNAGRLPRYDLLAVKVNRLEAEIALERAKIKAAPKQR